MNILTEALKQFGFLPKKKVRLKLTRKEYKELDKKVKSSKRRK